MKKFLKDTSGNFALITAFLSIPLFAAAGSVLDYGLIYNQRTDAQDGLDAAMLYAAQQINKLSDAEVKEEFLASLKSNITAEQFNRVKNIEYDIDRETGRLHVSLASGYPTTVLQVVGLDELAYTIQSEVRLGSIGGAEIVMALDTTLSMQTDNKIGALKTAATNFATELLENNAVDDKVKIGIVPFEQYVNVGLNNRNANWLDVEDDGVENICRNRSPVISKSGCTNVDNIVDGIVVGTYEQCTNIERGPEELFCSDSTTEWHGCVGSREDPLHIRDGSYNNRVPGLTNRNCATPILPMTARKSDILDTINNLTPSGETYMAAGMAWSLRVISDGAPFSEGVSYKTAQEKNTLKIIVLMSDGENTFAPNSGDFKFHDEEDPDLANQFTLDACAEAKTNDITIYTIGFGDEITEETETLLKDCATKNEQYFSANDAQQLQTAFNTISNDINAIFLSQ